MSTGVGVPADRGEFHHGAQETGMPDMNVKKFVSYFENRPYLYLKGN